MARARLALCFTLLTLLMSIHLSALTDPPAEPPANSPEADAPNSPTQPPLSPSPDISSPPAPPSEISSPPAPPPDSSSPPSPSLPPSDDNDDDENEGPSPSPSSDDDPEADAPAPEADEWSTMKSGVKPVEKRDDGMSGGKKAGIVIGVFAFAGLAALAGFVYKKRKENMERAAFGAAVRREFL